MVLRVADNWAKCHRVAPPPRSSARRRWRSELHLLWKEHMAKPLAEIIVTLMNFSGAAILSIDALRIRQSAKEKAGAEKLIHYLSLIGKGDLVTDTNGKPLDSEAAIEEWLGTRTQRLGWIGFTLLALGFLLDLMVKITASS